jgi:GDP-4-dehydro-6-deoxy-D-mannose reductase
LKVLIFGITGFSGITTLNMLLGLRVKNISGTYRHSSSNRDLSHLDKSVNLYECDINDTASIENVLNTVKPDIIFHFSAYVSVFSSIKNPTLTFKTNVIGTINLFESIKKIVPLAKVLLPGSAEQYGFVSSDKMPIEETYNLNPSNPYAISKNNQEEIGLYYFKQFGLNIYFTRTFHCTGPLQPVGFVCSDITKQIVNFERGLVASIKIGNLEAKRDFTDIRDVVLAYWQIINKGMPGEIYNVCIGKSIAINEILNILINLSGKKIPFENDESKMRKADVPDFIGNNSKLINLGWAPQYEITESLSGLLNSFRVRN